MFVPFSAHDYCNCLCSLVYCVMLLYVCLSVSIVTLRPANTRKEHQSGESVAYSEGGRLMWAENMTHSCHDIFRGVLCRGTQKTDYKGAAPLRLNLIEQ